MNTELIIIIDPQNDFMNEAFPYAKRHSGISQISEVGKNINKLLSVKAPNEVLIVISHYNPNQFEDGLSICIPGTEGHKIAIEVDPSFAVISKNEHSCFSSAAFDLFLQEHAIKKLILCGFLAEYCVMQTALDGLERGYEITLMKDCIGTGDDVQFRKDQMLQELSEKSVQIIEGII